VLVVNSSYSEIDEITLEDALLGQTQYTYFVAKEPNDKVPEPYMSRAENSVNHGENNAQLISAIIVYKRKLHLWGMEFKKNIILNKYAKYPLSSKEYKKLSRFNLAKI